MLRSWSQQMAAASAKSLDLIDDPIRSNKELGKSECDCDKCMLAFLFRYDAIYQHSKPCVLITRPLSFGSDWVNVIGAGWATLVLATWLEAHCRGLVEHCTHSTPATSPSVDFLRWLAAHVVEKIGTEVVVRRLSEVLDCGLVESMLSSKSEACVAAFLDRELETTTCLYIYVS